MSLTNHVFVNNPHTTLSAQDFKPASPIDDDREPLLRRDDNETKDQRAVSFTLSTPIKYCLLLFFLIELSTNVLTVPLISLFEKAICKAHFHDYDGNTAGSIGELDCKGALVQGELAKLRGWKAFFETMSGNRSEISPILLAFYADQILT